MLVVRQAGSVHAHLPHEADILLMVPLTERVADFGAVLMAADPVQGQVFTVEEEALRRVNAVKAEPQRLLHAVYLLAVRPQGDLGPVAEGVLRAVPQARPTDGQGQQRLAVLSGRQGHRLLGSRHGLVTVTHPYLYLQVSGGPTVGQLDHRLHLRLLTGDSGLTEINTR